MTRPDVTQLPAPGDWASIAELLAGAGFPFDVSLLEVQADGTVQAVVKRFYIRQPTTAEFDDADSLYSQTERAYRRSELVQELRGQPVEEAQALAAITDDKREAARLLALTADVFIARTEAALKRDRWLTARLLCDEDGKQLADTTTPAGIAAWDAIPIPIKDAARPVIWRMLETVRQLPLGWERLKDFASVSANGTDSPPTPNP